MRSFITSLFLIAGILLSLSANSQARIWTLSECIFYALDHNLQIKQQQLSSELSESNLKQSYYDLLPNLNGGIGSSYSTGRSVDPYTYEFTENNVSSMNFQVGSSVTLFSGFQKINTIEANKYSRLASLSENDRIKNDISLAIITSYLNILYAKELVANTDDQIRLTRQQLERTQVLYNAGSIAMGSVLEVKAQLAAEETQLVQAENQLRMALLTMTQMMELKDADGFDIAEPDVSQLDEGILKQSVLSIYDVAVQQLPQVKAAEFRLKSTHANYKVAMGSYYPKLTASASFYSGYSNNRTKGMMDLVNVGSQPIGFVNSDTVFSFPYQTAQLSYVDYPFSEQFNDNAYKSLSFNLSIPIFNNYQIRHAVNSSRISLQQSEYQLESIKNQLFKEIQQAHSDALASMNRYQAAQKSLAASEESFSYIQTRFDAGLISSLDYNSAKNQLTKIQSDLLQSKYEYLFKIGILEYYLGSNPY